MMVHLSSLDQLPQDIVSMIAQQCDRDSLCALRQTCHRCNEVGKTDMKVDLAARVVFYHPEVYRTFRLNSLKESRPIVLNVLTKMPEMLFDPSMPEQFLHDEEMIKTAYVAAFLLKKNPLAADLLQRYEELLGDIQQMLIVSCSPPDVIDDRHYVLDDRLGDFVSVLGRFQPYVLYNHLFEFASSAIKKHLDIGLEVIGPQGQDVSTFLLLDPILRDNEELVRRVISIAPGFLQYCSERLRDDEEFLSSIKVYIACNCLSPRLQNSPLFRLKLANNRGGYFASPFQVDTSSLLGKIVQALINFQESCRKVFSEYNCMTYLLFLFQKAVVKLIMFFVQIPDPRRALELFQPFSKEPASSH